MNTLVIGGSSGLGLELARQFSGQGAEAIVAGPADMSTAFWKHDPGRDMSGMLDPKWVADQIMKSENRLIATNTFAFCASRPD